MALFGMTIKMCREQDFDKKEMFEIMLTDLNWCVYLILNAVFINEGMEQRERLKILNKITIDQMRVLDEDVENK